MARNEPDDIDSLLAEVERSLDPSAGRTASPARCGASGPARPDGGSASGTSPGLTARATRRLVVALVAAAVCAGLVFVAFFYTPFVGAISGAWGAGIAGFITALLLPRRL